MKLSTRAATAALALALTTSPWASRAQGQVISPPPAVPSPAAAASALPAPPSHDLEGPEVAASAPAAPSCSVLTQRALSTELRAATALSQNKGVDESAKLFDRAIAQWTLALDGCEGRPRERAQKHLSESERQRALLAERQAAGSQCELSHRDAAALQDLAARAFGDRRWVDAASLYSKTETMWDLAAEHCTGSQQEIARKRREQAETDAHNAEHCAPLFDRARDYTQKFRAAAAGLNPTERQQQSQTAETLWRKAVGNCKGSALELAGNNAQALARERGTPWVATQLTEPALAPSTPASPKPPATSTPTATPAAMPAATSAASGDKASTSTPTLRPQATAAAANAAAPAAASTAAGSTTAVGRANAPGGMLGALSGMVAAAANPLTPSPATTPAPAVPNATAPLAATPSPALPDEAGGASTRPAGEAYRTNAYLMDILTGDTRYKGLFAREDGQVISGNGRVEWSNGDVYIGDLLRSIRHGKGEFIWANGQRYSGDWVQNKATGRGKINFPNGNQYEGMVVDGTPAGEGQMTYASGDVYKGQVSAGIPHGRGNYRWNNGQQFEGELQRGVPHGKGVLRFASGARYEGTILAGQPQGQGVMHYMSGDRYEGNFQQGQSHGQGSYFWKAGERYVGAWRMGSKHGKGIFYWPNGDRWEGDFKDDARTEFGEFIPKE